MMKSDHNSNHASSSTGGADSKILTDLETLSDQIELCQTMLGSTPPSQRQHDEALLAVVGFLEACVPRMVELVDAAAQGALSQESTLERCLEVNDALLKTLENFDDPNYMGGGGTAAAAAAASAGVEEEEEGLAGDLDDLLTLDVKSPPIKGGGKSTGEEEPDDDAFDAFFKERTS
mmetsp:Transcript_22492/g.33139  ORF Transcript_22492/g.33139 Transcript_22492/m.33139 type:complete len:176 (+) Transcript_22492:255-782(+)